MTQAMCTSFKKELFTATHNFSVGGDSFKVACYTPSATLDATTTVYSATNEVANTGTYAAGGFSLTNADPDTSGTTAMTTFSSNPTWSNVTFTTNQALIYNTSKSNKAVAVLDFGGSHSVVNGTFTINFPAFTSTTALLRLL